MFFIEKVAFATHDEASHCSSQSAVTNGATQNAAIDSHRQEKHSQIERSNKQKSAIALCCAMSVHSFFEAAALGLAGDATSALMMSACIALHQPAESVALLVAFLKAEMPTQRTILWLMSFSMMSLVGVSAGLMVNKLASGDLEAVVTAITAGTFIYVGATEVKFRACFLLLKLIDCVCMCTFPIFVLSFILFYFERVVAIDTRPTCKQYIVSLLIPIQLLFLFADRQ